MRSQKRPSIDTESGRLANLKVFISTNETNNANIISAGILQRLGALGPFDIHIWSLDKAESALKFLFGLSIMACAAKYPEPKGLREQDDRTCSWYLSTEDGKNSIRPLHRKRG